MRCLTCVALCAIAFSCAMISPAVYGSSGLSVPPRSELPELSLAEAASLAVANSWELEYRTRQLELSRGAWRLGLRSFFPSLRIDYGNDERLSLDGGDSFSKRISLGLSQLLWDGGRLASSRKLERSELDVAMEELRGLRSDAADAAVNAYRSIVAARKRLSVRLSTMALASTELGILELKGELGLLTGAELSQARLKLSNLGLEIDEERLRLSESEAQLAQLLGMETLPPLFDGFNLEAPALDLEAIPLLELAIERSPALTLARRSVDRKRMELIAAKQAWLPVLSLDATLSAGGAQLPLQSGSWTIAIRVAFDHPWLGSSMSVGLGGSSRSGKSAQSGFGLDAAPEPRAVFGIAAAERALRLEDARLAQTEAAVRVAALSAIRRYQNAAKAVELARQALSLAEDGLAIARIRESLGQAPPGEALDAELERAAKELGLVDAYVRLLERGRELERLLDFDPGQLDWYIREVRK